MGIKPIKSALSYLRSMSQNKKVMVAGPFRSGTNLMKYYLDESGGVEVVFSQWFWKHGLPPSTEEVAIPDTVPIAIMARDPEQLNISLFKFWKKRRPELDAGHNISEFIRKPLIVYDNTGGNVRPKYYFSSPTDYWNQFYYAWINWLQIDARRMFIKLEDLHAAPESVISSFVDFASLDRKRKNISPPDFYLSASPDGRRVNAATAAFEKGRKEEIILGDEDRAAIAVKVNPEIAEALGYDDYARRSGK
jgi:hypothetical protein